MTEDLLGRQLNKIDEARELIRNWYVNDPRPWNIGYSAGKDSTLLLQLICEVKEQHKEINKPLCAVFNDTAYEIGDKLTRIKNNFERLNKLGFETAILSPPKTNKILPMIIGDGYPPPSFKFRWCANYAKFKQANKHSRDIAIKYGGLIDFVGTRKEESTNRKKRLTDQGAPHELYKIRVKNKWDEAKPIADVKTDELWEYLETFKTFAWGESLDELKELYPNKERTQRDGCWCCSICSDRSFSNKDKVSPAQYKTRMLLISYREDINKRCMCRTAKQLNMLNHGFPSGYLTLDARKELLAEIQAIEKEYKEEIIPADEVEIIKAYWKKFEEQKGTGVFLNW